MKIFERTFYSAAGKKVLPAFVAVFSALSLWAAGDAAALLELEKAKSAMAEEDYSDAAEYFAEAELQAESSDIGAAALLGAIEANRKNGMFYEEFLLIEKMLTKYPDHGDYAVLVAREYEIANLYRDGYRQRAFASLRWLSWLTDVDKTEEIYNTVLQRAPYADSAPNAKFDLALYSLRNYRNVQERNAALQTLREIIDAYPGTQARYYAQLELANALFQLTGLGDGDSAHAEEGIAVLEQFLAENPGAPERPEMEKQLQTAKDLAAERLMGTADFYLRINRPHAAERYLSRLLRNYPDSVSAPEAEKMLTELDPTYVPDRMQPMETPERAAEYPIYAMPANYERLLVAPENSDGKWLRPIYDFNLPKPAGDTAENNEDR